MALHQRLQQIDLGWKVIQEAAFGHPCPRRDRVENEMGRADFPRQFLGCVEKLLAHTGLCLDGHEHSVSASSDS